MIKAWLRHYFGFSTKESRGFLALCALTIVILFSPGLFIWLAPDPSPIEVTITELKADSLLQVLESTPFTPKRTVTLFSFDPNVANEAELTSLGMPTFLAQRIQKYRDKGGRFRVKKDLLRIYGMPEDLYASIEDYIELPDSLDYKKSGKEVSDFPTKYNEVQRLVIDINAADSSEWEKINGIGTTLAKRIVKFRDRLGGFAQKEQLYEVYGLDSSMINSNWDKFILDTPCEKIHINAVQEEALASHPYVGWKVAKVIVNYRKQHGDYKKAEDLLSIGILQKDKWEKLKAYLEF